MQHFVMKVGIFQSQCYWVFYITRGSK